MRSLADSGIGKSLPGLRDALADLPDRVRESAIRPPERGGDHRSPSSATALDAIADGLSRDLPQVDWRNGTDGVLDAPWAGDPALLPDLLPIAIAGKATTLHGEHRAATFAAATDTQLRALGVADADIANIRAGLDRSPHHAANAIDDAFTRLDPYTNTARAAQVELAAADATGGMNGKATITRLPDGTFRLDDAEGNEIGTALDAEGARRLVDVQRATMDGGHSAPRNQVPTGSDRNVSPGAPLSEQIRSLFAEPLDPANFETYHESRSSVLEIARQTGIEIVRPLGSREISRAQSIHTRRLGEALGIEILYYRGGQPNDLGFTPAGNPELIFIHVGSAHTNIPAKWVFPHELLHVAQKDASSGATELGREIESFLTDNELKDIHAELASYGYKPADFATELPAFLTGDAISGQSVFGLDDLTHADRIRDLITTWFDGIGKLNPSSLGNVVDDELASVRAAQAELAATDAPGSNEIDTALDADGSRRLVESVTETAIDPIRHSETESSRKLETDPKNKPLYSPDPKKWIAKGGSIDHNWTYTDWEGNTVPYPDGFPDFQDGGYVHATVEIVQKGNRTSDFRDADAKYGGSLPPELTWHHYQNGTTMQAVNAEIHRRFTHLGGVSVKKRKKKP